MRTITPLSPAETTYIAELRSEKYCLKSYFKLSEQRLNRLLANYEEMRCAQNPRVLTVYGLCVISKSAVEKELHALTELRFMNLSQALGSQRDFLD